MGRSLRTFVLVSFLATVSSTALSLGIVENEDGDYSLEATGSARITGVYLINPDIGEIYSRRNDGLGNGVLRLMLDGDLGQYMTFHVNSFAGFSRQPLLDGGSFSNAGSSQTPYRTEYLSWNSGTEDDVRGFTGLDRFSLHLLADPLNLTVHGINRPLELAFRGIDGIPGWTSRANGPRAFTTLESRQIDLDHQKWIR